MGNSESPCSCGQWSGNCVSALTMAIGSGRWPKVAASRASKPIIKSTAVSSEVVMTLLLEPLGQLWILSAIDSNVMGVEAVLDTSVD